tara:strand:+ start:128 stop:892 length:765 start_codon:yes stop_codon:yes gene_type:complete
MVKKKILIFIITYKASFRLRDVFNKIPFKKLNNYKVSTLISDDASKDNTILFANKILRNNKKKKIVINENKSNIGYGAHIKKCLSYSIKNKFDYAIMIHGDGQYSPTYIPELLKSLSSNKNIGASTGSRLKKGKKNASKGGMPFYKLLGNIILTKVFNTLLEENFTDTHTGLWAYNLQYLKNGKYQRLTDSFNFDQEFRFKNILDNKYIMEIPIKTKYGDERSQLHVKYAINFFFRTLLFYCIKNKIIKSKKFN